MRNQLKKVLTLIGFVELMPRALPLAEAHERLRSTTLLLVCVCAASLAHVQIFTAAIHGTVADTSGAVISDGTITMTQTAMLPISLGLGSVSAFNRLDRRKPSD